MLKTILDVTKLKGIHNTMMLFKAPRLRKTSKAATCLPQLSCKYSASHYHVWWQPHDSSAKFSWVYYLYSYILWDYQPLRWLGIDLHCFQLSKNIPARLMFHPSNNYDPHCKKNSWR